MAKLPSQPDLERLETLSPELLILPAGELVARIFYTSATYRIGWRSFRYFGPTDSRFDHHLKTDKPSDTGDRGIMYLASGRHAINTCLAEVFQVNRFIDTASRGPALVIFKLERDLSLLNLRGAFATRMGASSAIHSGRRSNAQNWSRALYERYPDIDGIGYCSSMNGLHPAIALFERAEGALPSLPQTHRLLSDPLLTPILGSAALSLGYRLNLLS